MAEHIVSQLNNDKIASILSKTKLDAYSVNKHGSNSSCQIVECEKEKYAVLTTGNIEVFRNQNYGQAEIKQLLQKEDLVFSKVMKLTQKHKKHNAVPILGYVYNDEKFSQYVSGCIVQECAKGEELYGELTKSKLNNEELITLIEYTTKYANVPAKHFSAFFKNFIEIGKDLQIDPSKRSNFFYDATIGFSFIDLNFLSNGEINQEKIVKYIISQFRPFSFDETCSIKNIKEYVVEQVKLLKKLEEGLLLANAPQKAILEEIEKQKDWLSTICEPNFNNEL